MYYKGANAIEVLRLQSMQLQLTFWKMHASFSYCIACGSFFKHLQMKSITFNLPFWYSGSTLPE